MPDFWSRDSTLGSSDFSMSDSGSAGPEAKLPRLWNSVSSTPMISARQLSLPWFEGGDLTLWFFLLSSRIKCKKKEERRENVPDSRKSSVSLFILIRIIFKKLFYEYFSINFRILCTFLGQNFDYPPFILVKRNFLFTFIARWSTILKLEFYGKRSRIFSFPLTNRFENFSINLELFFYCFLEYF